jgi:hypothetical protein
MFNCGMEILTFYTSFKLPKDNRPEGMCYMNSVKAQITVLEFTHTVGQDPSKFNAVISSVEKKCERSKFSSAVKRGFIGMPVET